MGFPARRLRRLRQNEAIRGLVRENNLSVSNFILPLFVVPGSKIRREIASLPGNYHLSIDCLVEEAIAARILAFPPFLCSACPRLRMNKPLAPTPSMASCRKPSEL